MICFQAWTVVDVTTSAYDSVTHHKNFNLVLLQSQMESAVQQAEEYKQAVLTAEARLRDSSRQIHDLQQNCEELARKWDAAERARQQLQEQLTTAEVRAGSVEVLKLLRRACQHLMLRCGMLLR